jgi:diguanylate cyclase (GGDEF)-like protein
LDKTSETRSEPAFLTATSNVRLLRFRLRLALLTMAVVPVIAVTVLAGGSLAAFVAGGPLPIVAMIVLTSLSVVMIGLALWISHQVLRPTEALENSRAELQRMYEAAKADSMRDGLTGLGNFRAFQEELDHQIEWYQRYKVPLALLVVDIDDLNVLNESEGHAAGDEVLREMGHLIGQSARYADRSFRIGGDKFAVLMPHTDVDGAMQLGRRLLATAAHPKGNGHSVSFSAGVSACPALATSRTQLFAQASAALAWCKRHGRGSIDAFDPVRDRDADQNGSGELSASVMHAATQGLLHAVYQPIVDLSSGIVIGFEGLIRPAPETGFADPMSLVAAAASVGRSVELDHACIATIAREARGLSNQQLLSINVSPRFLEAPQFAVEWIINVLAAEGIEPSRVIVELTEREYVEDQVRLQRNLNLLQRAGVRVAADDVGAGNAGLRLLSQFRFDIVKLDLTLVQDSAQRDSSRAVLRSLRELAARSGSYTVAEGLETLGQLRMVREIGVTAGQGYLLCRPMAAPNLLRVDLNLIEAGGVVMSSLPPPPPPPLAHIDFARAQTG